MVLEERDPFKVYVRLAGLLACQHAEQQQERNKGKGGARPLDPTVAARLDELDDLEQAGVIE
jgi:hypothetical protein